MSVDPTQPSAPDPTSPQPPAEPAANEGQETLPQKRRYKRGNEAEETGEKPDATIEVLSSLLQDLVAKKDQRAPVVEQPSVPSKAAKYHRLSKTGNANPAAPAEASPPSTDVATTATSSPPPAATPAAAPLPAPSATSPAVTFRPAPLPEPDVESRRAGLWKTLFFVSLLALVGLGIYAAWFLRPADRPDVTARKISAAPASAWTDAALRQLDEALTADQAGDLNRARSLAAAITPANASPPPGLSLYLASLDTRTERTFDAEGEILRLTKDASPETFAALQAGLGFNFTRTRDFEKAAEVYRVATHSDPFSATLFYHQGEVARHAGHLPEAVVSFQRALERVPTGQPEVASLRDCAAFKLRLCLIEQGREGDFQAELDEQLKSPSPAGHWLLTAAAVALQHKDLPAAADLLTRARVALGQATFDGLLNDYFFRAYADRKELAEFFPDSATRRAKLMPTQTHTIDP